VTPPNHNKCGICGEPVLWASRADVSRRIALNEQSTGKVWTLIDGIAHPVTTAYTKHECDPDKAAVHSGVAT
jgi:hypothetical protein